MAYMRTGFVARRARRRTHPILILGLAAVLAALMVTVFLR
jgi:hypothetical protein